MDNNYLSRLKSLFSESVSNQDYLEELKVSDNVQELLENRYFVNLFNGKENTYKQLCKRVSRVVAATELYHYSQKTDTSFDYIINHDESASELLDYIRRVEYSIYTDMLNGNFLFNSPCLFSAGTGFSATENGHLLYDDEITLDDYRKIYNNVNNKNQMLFACFVIGIEDSIEGIFESVKKCAIISKSGGGVGLNFSPLREKNAKIRGNEGLASGVVSFAGDFNAMGDSIRQGGKRRVALMGMLNSNHPDIEEFINCKTEEGKLTNFNISVAIDDKFMEAIQNDSNYDLISSVDGHIVKTVKARELWNSICESAWKRGDPGIFFVDLANKDSLLKYDEDYRITGCNPCAEECLPNYTSCNLGSINLANFVLNNKFDDSEFTKMVKRGLYYLDLVIDTSAYPLPEIEERTKDIRPVGLGMMGLADLFIKLNIRYGSKESNELAENIAQLMAGQSLYESVMLGEIKGSFPAWRKLPQQNLLNVFETEYMLNTPNYENMDNTYFEKVVKGQIKTEIPISFIKAFYSLSQRNIEQFRLTLKKFCDGFLRHSRRLTGPPTGCAVKETMTITNEGILRFDELADINSDNQWTDLNNISVAQESTNTTATKFYINGHKPTKKILTRDGLTLECTYNHKYRVLDSGNNYVWKQADELNIGDKIVYRVGGYNKETNPKLDLEYKQYRSPKTVTFPEYMNEDLAFFIGVFTGNGSIDDDGKTIRIAVNMEKTEVNQRIIDVIKRLFDIDIKRISPTKGSKGGTIYLYSVEVTDKLIRLGLLKENSHLAKVPKLIRQSSISCINAFIDGLFVTDGYKDRHMRKITTVSHQLATELLIVLRAIGINGKIQIRNDKHHNATYYAVVFDIYGSNTFKNDKYVQDRFKRNHDDLLPIADNLYTTEVVEITDSENDTFDIEVPENNTYIANSYVSHNTISMILNTSSSLEPNFAFEWKRNITGSNGEVTTRIFKHKYVDIENKELLVTANELSPEEHINIVKAFAPYTDSSVSKTVNLSNSATVEDVKKVYENCYNNGIKGITIYRDMSREGQTLQKIDNTEKSNNKTEEKPQITEKSIERPKVISGYTQKGETNYGNLYATLNVVDGKPYELFVNIGKSGSLAKSLSEALSRTISISLQNGINIDEIIKTLNGIADSETPWVFEDYKGNEEWCKSIPDMIAKMMKSLSEYVKEIGAVEQKPSIEDKKDNNNIDMNSIIEHDKTSTDKKKILCPECLKNGNSIFLVQMAGCPTCPNCGWSACA